MCLSRRGPAATDLIAGRVDCTFAVMASGLPLVQNGQLRALGVSTASRQPTAADVPTIAEAGVPATTPPRGSRSSCQPRRRRVIRKIQADTVAVMAEPAIKTKLDALGVVIVGSTPEALATHLKDEMDKWGPVIKAATSRSTSEADRRGGNRVSALTAWAACNARVLRRAPALRRKPTKKPSEPA